MSRNYRCSKKRSCGARLSVKAGGLAPLKCPSCGNYNMVDVTAQERKRTKAQLCMCDGMVGGWPHRRGSSVWCSGHPTGPTEQDFKERYEYSV
jgi:predicted RNA-binding Zn-ribbon protein involved in translation (DUF1610 family)